MTGGRANPSFVSIILLNLSFLIEQENGGKGFIRMKKNPPTIHSLREFSFLKGAYLQFILINTCHHLLVLVFQLHPSLQVLVHRFSLYEVFNQ